MQFLDFSALELNALYFKKLLGDSKLCAVVKNNAYGHGIIHMARYLDSITDYFAVGSVEEAKLINFVNKDILILLPQDYFSTEAAISNGYVLSLDSLKTLDEMLLASIKLGKPARAHIKIDSGMSRLGFNPQRVDELVKILQKTHDIIIEGVYSHFYGDNVVDCDKQLDVFLACAQTIEMALNKKLIKHIANSGGVLLSEKYHLNMARVGLGLYGYGNNNLSPVKTVTANIVAVRNVNAGDVVGYGAKYVAEYDMRIAVLDVGYAHGFAHSLVGSLIRINGSKCKVLAVCMAMIMVDISDAVEAKVGDDAILLGDGVDISNGAVSIYELLCNLK